MLRWENGNRRRGILFELHRTVGSGHIEDFSVSKPCFSLGEISLAFSIHEVLFLTSLFSFLNSLPPFSATGG